MRKLVLLLLIIFGNLVCFSQTKTNKVKWVYNKLDLNSIAEDSGPSTVYGEHGEILRVDEPSEHLKFKGIPITGSEEDFYKKLLQKGIKASRENDDEEIYFKSKGVECDVCLFNPDFLSFSSLAKFEPRKMSAVFQRYFIPKGNKNKTNKDKFLMDLRREITRDYNCISREDFSELSTDFRPRFYSMYKVLDKYNEAVIGVIITGIHEYSDSYAVFAYYYDAVNCNTSFIQNGAVNWIDYSKYFPKYDEIFFADDNDFVRCYLKYNGTPYSFLFEQDDKQIILTLLENLKIPYVKNIMYYLLNDVMHNWLKGKYTFLPQNKFRPKYAELLAAYEKQSQQNQQKTQSRKFGFMDIMHMLAPGFFTQDDVDLWNKMPEENQKAVINGAFGVFGSMGGSTWDSLSPEQKMQIHQNDNAR